MSGRSRWFTANVNYWATLSLNIPDLTAVIAGLRPSIYVYIGR